MKRHLHSSISAIALSAVMISGAFATVSVTASPAFSKSDNANSNSNGGGRNNNGNRGGRDNNNGRGSEASSLGALNAAHANANALENAASNSRVGMIALYKSAVVASAAAATRIDDAQSAYDEYVAAQTAAGYVSLYENYDAYLNADPAPSEEEILYWETLHSLQTAIIAATSEAEIAKAIENEALALAANKETNDEVIEALWNLLDI